ncbi:MAG: type VI secretion system membrane subunit TssM [Pseudomonadota bacterium]
MQVFSYIGYITAASSIGGAFMLIAVIWFWGPGIGFDDFYPLEPVLNRVIAIVGVLLFILIYFGIKIFRGRRAAKALEDGVTQPVSDDGAVLAERMKDALKTLKKSNGGKDPLYSLPWYIVIGPPGTGKTTALINSGLKFPLLSGASGAMVEGVGGTRYCDWWFAEDAVLIDTAGRYTTQDSAADGEDNVDRRSWHAFLKLLKRTRPRQPINGAILAVGIDDLIQLSDTERNVQADAIRNRLLELHEQLKVAFPVYVVFTKADLIQGFMEFFGDLRETERRVVWGATFDGADRHKNTITEVPAELDALVMRLSELTIDRLQEEPNQARRSLVLGFPAQFNALREPVIGFMSRIFEPTRYHANAILRGFYFTSGTQEGTALDQLIGETSRVLGGAPVAMSGRGRSFFLNHLLQKVIFGEAGFVSYNRARIRRERALRFAGIGVVALLAVGAIGALTLSYTANARLIGTVDDAVTEYRTNAARLIDEQQIATFDVQEANNLILTPLRTFPVGYDARAAETPVEEGFGLSQRGRLTAAAIEAYYRGLERSFRPRLVLRVEEVLQANLDDPELTYETLKVYKMLTGENVEREVIVAWIVRDWEENVYSGPTNASGRRVLREHLAALLELDLGRPVQVAANVPLMRDAERVLARVPLVDLAFARLALDARADGALFDWVLADEAGADADIVFRTRSGADLDTVVVPSFYTRAGFQRALINRLPTIEREIQGEAWLYGEAYDQRAIERQFATLEADLLRRYQDRYIATWRGILDEVLLEPMAVDKPRYTALRALSAPTSPLRQLLQAVTEETRLTQFEAAAEPTDVAASGDVQLRINADVDNRAAVRDTVQAEPGAAVEAAFAPLHEMMSAETEPNLDPVIASLSEMHDRLVNLARGTAPGEGATQALGERIAALQAEAARLPDPAARLVQSALNDIEADLTGERLTRLSQAFNAQVTQQCQAIVSNRFPFVNSARDVSLGDFSTLFRPDGLLDKFRKDNLDVFIDKSGAEWAWLPGINLSATTLRAFEAAATIRDAFFDAASEDPTFEIIVTTRAIDPRASSGVLRVNRTIVFASRSTHSQQVKWPGDNADNRAVVSVTFGQDATTRRVEQTGPWALFRLIRQGRATAREGQLIVDFTVAGLRLSFGFTSNDGANPLTLPALYSFRCPTAL